MAELRLCGPDCQSPDVPHLDPEPDWIGDFPVMHGESDRPVPGSGHYLYGFYSGDDAYCLCGHPNYMTCPEPSSLLGMEIGGPSDG